MAQQQRIVVGLDDSEGGRAALAFALHDAARRDATVEAVAAFEIPQYWMALGGTMPITSTVDVREACRAQAARIADEVCAAMADSFYELPEVTVVAVSGSPSAVLLHAARDADLLVVGSRGRGGFTSAMLGSVSLHCVLHARCPVTVVHPDSVPVARSAAAWA
ncbi:universal stress protein [Pseudonocardia sp. GCM10023141]|uniref:universal stress protein n=1 Tax=Pseudonocardia sp. GCM10023141 TaxID=3252653 RepID=UPI00362339BF